MDDKGGRVAAKLVDVLIVDVIDQQLLSEYLKEYDISHHIAEDKEEALKKLGDFTFKLILIDVESPAIDGCEIVGLIRTDLKLNVPVVAIIAGDVELTKTKCFSRGINGCFTRPVSKIELVGVLTQFLPNELLLTKNIAPQVYQTIDLSYLREISMGDAGYELEMAEKFVELISDEIMQLTDCLEKGDGLALRRVIHKMRSTIYLMGLRPKLITAIDAIEYENLPIKQLKILVGDVIKICEKAREEVQVLLDNSM